MMSPELRDARERMRRIPVASVSDLFSLDPDEIEEGYGDARAGMLCGDNRSRAYWHGWRTGMVDCRRAEPDAFAIALVKDVIDRYGDPALVANAHRKQFAWLQSMGLA